MTVSRFSPRLMSRLGFAAGALMIGAAGVSAQSIPPTLVPTATPAIATPLVPTAIARTPLPLAPESGAPTLVSREPRTRTLLDEPLTQTDLTVLTANVQRPNGLAWLDGRIYAACTGDDTIYEIDADTGQTSTYIWGVYNAHMMHVEYDAFNGVQLWAADYEQNTLTRVGRGESRAAARDLEGPWGIVALDMERFLISNLRSNTLDIVTRTGERETIVEGLASPTGIALHSDAIYIANNGSTRRSIEWIGRTDALAGRGELQPLVSGAQNVTGIQIAADGYLYFAYSLGTRGVVGRVDPLACRDGGCTVDQIEVVIYSELAAPIAGMIVSPDMRVYLHTMFSPEIYWAQL